MTEQVGLKPCPFCGSMPGRYPAQVILNGYVPESVSCENDACDIAPSTEYLPFHQAIAAWNRRAEG